MPHISGATIYLFKRKKRVLTITEEEISIKIKITILKALIVDLFSIILDHLKVMSIGEYNERRRNNERFQFYPCIDHHLDAIQFRKCQTV